ncbi:MAG: thioredoxin domain-containing protein [Anaerolineae bacterium]|nr:thioredoxin domain-containing protein [Anaerolineae bacterium]
MSNRTRTRKAEREAARRRQQQMLVLGGVIVIAIVAVALVLLANVPPAVSVEAVDPARYAGIEQRVNADGLPELGSASAPVVMAEYSNFSCSHCRDFHNAQFMQLLDDVRAGTLRIVFVPISDAYTTTASAGAVCAAQQDRFWDLHDVLFDWQGLYGVSGFSRQSIMAGAEALGLDMDAFSSCIASAAVTAQLENFNQSFRDLAEVYPSVTGTPTLTFNGVPPSWGSGAGAIADLRALITQAAGG